MDLVLTRRGLLRRGRGLFLLGASGIFLGAACSSTHCRRVERRHRRFEVDWRRE